MLSQLTCIELLHSSETPETPVLQVEYLDPLPKRQDQMI